MEILYDGDFVLTKSGSKDFGEITLEISKIICRQAGKIRFQKGFQNPKNDRDGFGEAHFNRNKRMSQIKEAGYECARDFVEDVSANFTKIYQGKGFSLILVKECEKNAMEYIQLKPFVDGDFWEVTSGHLVRKDMFKSKTPLWNKPKAVPSSQIQEGRSPTNSQGESPSAISDSSDI